MREVESIIGQSTALTEVLEQVSQLAAINRPILVLGERGTGKELAAERLHYLSPRWDAPLLKVNCAAMAESLLDSELFGHEPGAFTGATRVHRGRFERADGGTLFLDELGNMSLRLQEKLLRVIEYGEFERLGGQRTLQVDVRVLAATHADLRSLAEQGRFRNDLLDRLSFDVVHLPPLRYRPGDILELSRHFAVQMSAELGWEVFPGFTDDAVATLEGHAWPGNVRELKNTVERSLYRWNDPDNPVDVIVVDPFASPYECEKSPSMAAVQEATEGSSSTLPFGEHMQQVEKTLLQRALLEHDNNQRRTADALGLRYDQLRGLVRKHGLSVRKRRSS
jgi:psp operon transcriptional activator